MKFYLFLFAIILLSPLVLAISSVQISDTEQGMLIESPKYETIILNEAFKLHLHVYNISTGFLITNETASCRINLYNATGSHILKSELEFEGLGGYDFELSIAGGNFSELGLHSYIIWCNDSEVGGFVSGDLEVTPKGYNINSESRAESLNRAIYSMLAIGLILMLGFFFYHTSESIKWTLFMISITFLLIAINLIGITISDEAANTSIVNFFDGFTAISFYFYWFAGGLLILIWGFTFFNTWFLKKNLENIRNYG